MKANCNGNTEIWKMLISEMAFLVVVKNLVGQNTNFQCVKNLKNLTSEK